MSVQHFRQELLTVDNLSLGQSKISGILFFEPDSSAAKLEAAQTCVVINGFL